MNERRYIIAEIAVIILTAAALAFFIVQGVGLDGENTVLDINESQQQQTLGFGIPDEYANKPVKGELQVLIDEANVPEVPDTMTVYEMVFPMKTTDDLREYAGKFGVRGKILSERVVNGYSYGIRSGDLTFVSYPGDGRFEFRKDIPSDSPVPDIPSAEECEEIALDKLEELDLLPPEVIITGEGSGGGSEPGNPSNTVTWNRQVMLSRKLDGYPIRGSGVRINVIIGHKGELIRLNSGMRDFKPFGEYDVKTSEEAIEDARSGNGTINLHSDVVNPTVGDIRLIYYADYGIQGNTLLQPVFALSSHDTSIFVPAIKQ